MRSSATSWPSDKRVCKEPRRLSGHLEISARAEQMRGCGLVEWEVGLLHMFAAPEAGGRCSMPSEGGGRPDLGAAA